MNNIHLSLEAKLSSLYAPEIRFEGSFSTPDPKGMKIMVEGSIGGQEICIIQATGCTPNRKEQTLSFHDGNEPFSFILAWRDKDPEPASSWGMQGLRSIAVGLHPFESQIFKLNFSGIDCNLTTSLHIEIPHYLTRYTKDTKNLQHMFSERGFKSPSYMGGIAEQCEDFQMHLHYKSLDAFRRISTPALTMVSVLLLDLAVMELAGGEGTWSDEPGAVLAFLSINAAAFGSLAAIRVGSTLRSLLNLVRLVGVLWVLMLTATIRAHSLPYIKEHIGAIIDAGLKASIVWLCIIGFFSFFPYALVRDSKRRSRIFEILTVLGFVGWLALVLLSAPLDVANSFASLINK